MLGEKFNPMSVQSKHHVGLVSSRDVGGHSPCNQPTETWHVQYHIQIVLKGMGLRAEYIHEVTWITSRGGLF